MPLQIRISRSARSDLLEAWSYLANEDFALADGMLDRILEVADKLATWPEMGRARPDLRPDLRSFPIGTHVVYYRVLPDALEVVRVLHGRRDVDAIF